MIIHLDTSLLIDALTTSQRSVARLDRTIAQGHQLRISTLVLHEWLRGPRTPDELLLQESFLPSSEVAIFGVAEARRASVLSRRLARSRGRIMDIAIAACALEANARLWTLNHQDFSDIPELLLYAADDRESEPTVPPAD